MEQAIFLKKEQQQIKKELNFDFCGFYFACHNGVERNIPCPGTTI